MNYNRKALTCHAIVRSIILLFVIPLWRIGSVVSMHHIWSSQLCNTQIYIRMLLLPWIVYQEWAAMWTLLLIDNNQKIGTPKGLSIWRLSINCSKGWIQRNRLVFILNTPTTKNFLWKYFRSANGTTWGIWSWYPPLVRILWKEKSKQTTLLFQDIKYIIHSPISGYKIHLSYEYLLLDYWASMN